MKKCKVEDLEKAITQYLETNNLSSLRDFVGNCKGLAPYGEIELGDTINSGDFDVVAKLLNRMSNFADTSENETKPADKEWDEDEKAIDSQKADLEDTTDKRKYYEQMKKVADKHNGLGGSKLAQSEKELYDQKMKDLGKNKDRDRDKKYLDDKKQAIEDFKKQLNASENRGNKMEISKKDLTKIMSAMKTINKHFAEEAEDQVAEDQVEETTEDEEVETEEQPMQVVELPEDVANALREALNETSDDEEEIEDDEEDISDDEDEDEEESEEVDMCGDSNFSNIEEFYKFSEAITETITNLNKKADKLAKESIDAAKDFVENFSESEFRAFAESVTATLENIASRVDMLNAKVTKNEVTKNIDSLKETGDDMEEKFITKSDEQPKIEPVVENPEVSVAETAQFSENENHYQAVKDFLSL